ncbi:MAG TPA: DUF4956 domain-containing protein [Tangfeifania sp.]|nr:DUF4956 domain-containing protein [Tangfeifania sp.]
MSELLTITTSQLDFLEMLSIRFAFNLAATFIIVVLLYARISKRKEFYFSYFAISIAVFLLVFLLESVKIELGFALGLFAIFGIIRYRTDAIPPKEMTYLFIIIAVSVINALSKNYFGYLELTFVNLLMIGALWALEKVLMMRQENSVLIVYENIENLHKVKEEELLLDLEKRTGVKIKRYQIDKMDFLRDTAWITIFFDNNGQSKREIIS